MIKIIKNTKRYLQTMSFWIPRFIITEFQNDLATYGLANATVGLVTNIFIAYFAWIVCFACGLFAWMLFD